MKRSEFKIELNKIYQGNCIDILKTFEDESVNCCITSPPYYGLRDYGVNGDRLVMKKLRINMYLS